MMQDFTLCMSTKNLLLFLNFPKVTSNLIMTTIFTVWIQTSNRWQLLDNNKRFDHALCLSMLLNTLRTKAVIQIQVK